MQELLLLLGYLKSEAAVYTALLELGSSQAGTIAKTAKLNRVSVYKALDKLIAQGLVSYTKRNNRKTFKAADISKIKLLVKEKKDQLTTFEKNIPNIIAEYTKKEEVQTEIYEGIQGVKAMSETFLQEGKKGDIWYVMGTPKKAEVLGGYYKDLNERAYKKRRKLFIIYNADAAGLFNIRKKQKGTSVRLMPKHCKTPAEIDVFGDNVAIVLFSPVVLAFTIKNKEVADSFKQYFQFVWNESKKA